MAELTPNDVVQKMAETVTDSAAKQYDDYSKTFVALDGKAQAVITAGGVLLGVIVALANAGKLNGFLTAGWFVLVLLPIAAALVAMVCGVLASRVAKVSVPFDVDRQIKEFNDLRNSKSDDKIEQEDLIGFHVQRHLQWKESLKSMATAISSKGKSIHLAQISVLIAAALTVVLVGLAALKAP
ncbi:hypothetical protein ACSFBX_31265 [Variovorax sp. RB2P76]|uniref:hypothetical protein n=1 Tax=Variovorax sp. RB2P76 TaxID=3443736 RepID=UPI003F4694CB